VRYPKKSENKFILQIEQISEKIIRLKQIDSIHFYVRPASGQSECTFVFSKNLEFLMELIKIMNPIREPHQPTGPIIKRTFYRYPKSILF